MYSYPFSGSSKPLVPCDGPLGANNKIVMSLWTKPLFSDAFYFSSIEDFFAFWTLSVQQASKVYGWNRMSLYTDDLGLELLNKLGLRFYRSYTSLNRLSDYDASLWALGKIETYRLQNTSFLHIDHDVFLWQRLPCHIENAPLVAQSSEYFMYGDKAVWWYDIERFVENFNLPHSWQAAIERKGLQTSVNSGIMGGQDYSAVRTVASDAFYILNDARNKPVWDEIHDKGFANTVLEQYTFARQAELQKKEISYLFPSGYEPSFEKEVGYTHLMGGYKKEPHLRDMVWAEIQQNYPEYLPRIFDTANYLRLLIEQKNISKGAYTMATDLRFQTRALVEIGPNGVVLNSNLPQSAAVGQEATFNSAFKAVTGNDLNTLFVQTSAEGTTVGFNGEGIHLDVANEIVLHCPDEFSSSIGKQNTFIAALSAITGGYPVSQVGLMTDAEPAV